MSKELKSRSGDAEFLPWKSTLAVKASNFGNVKARVVGVCPDPSRPGEMTSVTIANVFGGLRDDRAVATSLAAFIADSCNRAPQFEAAVKALQDIIEVDQLEQRVTIELDPSGNTYAIAMIDGRCAAIARQALSTPRGGG